MAERKSVLSSRRRPPEVISYVRFSTGEQSKGTGQRRQDDRAKSYCDKRNWTLSSRSYSDLGVSSFKSRNATHGELAMFLEAVREGRIRPGSVLLVESLDRLSRANINKALELFLSIINSGIVVITLADEAEYRADSDPHTLMAQMMISLAIFLRANDESRMKSQRKAASWKYKREAAAEGKPHGGKLPAWIKIGKDDRYEVVEKEADVVRDFFNRYVAGEGLYVLARAFGRNKSTLAYWIDSKVVLGTLTVTEEGRKVEIEHHYPAIIDRDLYALAQQRKAERYVGKTRGAHAFINLFQGLLYHGNDTLIVQQANDKKGDGTKKKKLYVADGLTLQVWALERHICENHLHDNLVERRVETKQSSEDTDRLAALEAKIQEIQTAMRGDVALFSTLLPVLKDVRKQHDEIKASATRVTYERANARLVDNVLEGLSEADNRELRMRLRGLIRDTVSRIDLDRIEGLRRRFVVGRITYRDGTVRPFRFAFDTRHPFIVPCDGTGDDPKKLNGIKGAEEWTPYPQVAESITDDVLAEMRRVEAFYEDAAERRRHRKSA